MVFKSTFYYFALLRYDELNTQTFNFICVAIMAMFGAFLCLNFLFLVRFWKLKHVYHRLTESRESHAMRLHENNTENRQKEILNQTEAAAMAEWRQFQNMGYSSPHPGLRPRWPFKRGRREILLPITPQETSIGFALGG